MAEEQDHTRAMVSQIIEGLVDPGFVVLKDVFSREVIHQWHAWAETHRAQGEMRSAGLGKSRALDVRIRQDQIHWLDFEAPELQPYALFVAALTQALNRELFLGISGVEGHFACYPTGGFYTRHRDRFTTEDTRQISLVVYLNPEWQACHGGECVLYDDAGVELARVVPQGNTLICFRSEMLHEVLPTQAMRYSLTGWLLRRNFHVSI